MPLPLANDAKLARQAAQIAHAVVWQGSFPESLARQFGVWMNSPYARVFSARMATTLGRAGAEQIRQDNGVHRALPGIVAVALRLHPDDFVAALEDVMDRLANGIHGGTLAHLKDLESDIGRTLMHASEATATHVSAWRGRGMLPHNLKMMD